MIGRQLFAPGAKRAAAQLLLNGRSRRGTLELALALPGGGAFQRNKGVSMEPGFFQRSPYTQRKLTLDGDSEPFTGTNNGEQLSLRRGGPISAYPR